MSVRVSFRIIPSSDLLGTFLPTSIIYPHSVSFSGLQLSSWGPSPQGYLSTINPVLAYESSPVYPFHAVLLLPTNHAKTWGSWVGSTLSSALSQFGKQWTAATLPRLTLGPSVEAEIFLPASHCLPLCFHCSTTLSFLSWLQHRPSSLDLCPKLTFKFWQVCSCIRVSLQSYLGDLTVDHNKALLGERLPLSTNWVVSTAVFSGLLKISTCMQLG
jgi:hypothetical protein